MNNQSGNTAKAHGSSLYTIVAILVLLAMAFFFAAHQAATIDAAELGNRAVESDSTMLESQPPESRRQALRHEFVELAFRAKEQEALHGVLLHAAIAFLVAALLITLVEIRVRRLNREEFVNYRENIASSIWNALSGQLVPPEVVAQIHSLLRFPIIRLECEYQLEFYDPPQLDSLNAADWILLRRRLIYKIKKLAPEIVVKHQISSGFDKLSRKFDANRTTSYPRFVGFTLDGVAQSLIDSANSIEREIEVRENEVQVVMETEELYERNENQIHYIINSPVLGLTINVVNTVRSTVRFTEVALTRAGAFALGRLEPFVEPANGGWLDGKWRYAGAVLPGQGFSVSWERVRTATLPAGAA